MANKNILKPSILNGSSPIPNPSTSKSNENTNPHMQTVDETQLVELINTLVINTLRREGRTILQSPLNPGADINNDVDQQIDAGNEGNISEMDKIPDVVKSLREFSGQPGEFSSWKKSVERILTIYEHLKGTAKYYGILNVIRNKITGQADVALESYNTPLNWEKISKCLTLHYADKRDLGTLEYQMTTLVQGNQTIPEFYQTVYRHLSLILNKLSSMEMSRESLTNMTQAYRDKALDTFVRGLKGDLPRLLSMKEPVDLPQALHLCLKLENVNFRVQHAQHTTSRPQHRPMPPIPPRRGNYRPENHRQFYPELVHNPQRIQRPNFHWQQQPQYYPRQTPLPPKPLPRPEPMDVDHSMRSRAVNYQNYPNRNRQFINKRPFSQQVHPPYKHQRINHIEQEESNEVAVINQQPSQETEYEQDIKTEDLNYEQTLSNYIGSNESSIFDPPERLDDIYFLD